MKMREMDPWYTNHGSLLELAAWLLDRGNLATPDDMLHFFETPWNYQEDWLAYAAHVDTIIGRACS